MKKFKIGEIAIVGEACIMEAIGRECEIIDINVLGNNDIRYDYLIEVNGIKSSSYSGYWCINEPHLRKRPDEVSWENMNIEFDLEYLIKDMDCNLFYDQNINTYFIYKWDDSPEGKSPIGHHSTLEGAIAYAIETLKDE